MEFHELDSDYEDDEPAPPKAKKLKSSRYNEENIVINEKRKDDAETKEEVAKAAEVDVIKPTSLQQRMLAISGQNIDEFMKEMENVHKKKEKERAADLQERLSTLEKDNPTTLDKNITECKQFLKFSF